MGRKKSHGPIASGLAEGRAAPLSMLDALPAHIAVVDERGTIVAVNESWRQFGVANRMRSTDFGVGQNYLAVCEGATGECAGEASTVAAGIRRVLRGELESPRCGAVIMHVDVTHRPSDDAAVREAQQRARESEQRLGFALNAAEIGDWDMDLRTNVVRRSLRHAQCFGYREVTPGWGFDTFLAHVHPEDRAQVEERFQAAMRGKGDYDLEIRVIWPDASVHWLWIKGRFYYDASTPYRVAGIVVDITARKQVEQQLRRNKASLVASQRIAHLGSWELDLIDVADLSEGALRWSDEVFRIWGHEPGGIEVSYDNFLAAVHPDDRALIADAVATALREERPYDLTHRILRPDGTERTVREQAEFQFDPISGHAVRMIGTVLDITEARAAEQALQRALDRLHNAQRLGDTGDWEWDLDAGRISWSPQLFAITGRDPESGPPRSYEELESLFDQQSRDIQRTHVTRALETGAPQRYALTVVRANGEHVYTEAFAIAQRDATGTVRRLLGTLQDVTGRRRAEAVLAASEQRLELATLSAGIGIWDWDIADNSIIWDARMYELYGIAVDDFASPYEAWKHAVHREDWSRMSAMYERVREGHLDYSGTFRILWPSGEERHIEARAVVQRSEQGSPVRMIGVNWDVTERVQKEEQLSQLADIVASSDDAIIGKNLQSVITTWNRGAEKIFGYTAQEMIGSAIARLIPDDRRHEEESLVARVNSGESVEHFETIRRTKSGRLIEVFVTASPISDAAGTVVGMSTVSRDISERKKLERQFYRAQRMESIGTLAGGIAHDLNNVLSPIIFSLDLLRASIADEETQELLAVLHASAEHGAEMVRQVLSFARGVEGKRLEVDVAALLTDVSRIAHDTFLKHISITSKASVDLHPVLGDRTQLQQVLMNLCVNARDAMPQGGTLSVSAENVRLDARHDDAPASMKPGEYLRLRVQDSGIGMSPEVMERIFDPFYTTKELGKGTGLGLSTSLAIVESHGGFMRVYSERGRGTTFAIYLPAYLDGPPSTAVTPPDAPRGNGELVLVVDDEDAVRLLTRRILESHGYRAVLATDGVHALTQFEAHRADLAIVLTDMMMPGMDGPTLVRELRARAPALRIVGTSGLSPLDADDDTLRLDLAGFLPKPSTADALLRLLHGALHPPG